MKNHNKLSNIITALVLVLVTLAVVLLSKFTGNSNYSESGQTFAPVNGNIDIKIGDNLISEYTICYDFGMKNAADRLEELIEQESAIDIKVSSKKSAEKCIYLHRDKAKSGISISNSNVTISSRDAKDCMHQVNVFSNTYLGYAFAGESREHIIENTTYVNIPADVREVSEPWMTNREPIICLWKTNAARGLYTDQNVSLKSELLSYSDDQLYQYVKMMKQLGFTGIQVTDMCSSWAQYGGYEYVQQRIRFMADAAHSMDMKFTLWVWGAEFDGYGWVDKDNKYIDFEHLSQEDEDIVNTFDKYYSIYAKLADCSDRVIMHFNDPGNLNSSKDIGFFAEEFRKKCVEVNPSIDFGINCYRLDNNIDEIKDYIPKGTMIYTGAPHTEDEVANYRGYSDWVATREFRRGVWSWNLCEMEIDQAAEMNVNAEVIAETYRFTKEAGEVMPPEYWGEMDSYHLLNIFSLYCAANLLQDPCEEPDMLLHEISDKVVGEEYSEVLYESLSIIQDARSGRHWDEFKLNEDTGIIFSKDYPAESLRDRCDAVIPKMEELANSDLKNNSISLPISNSELIQLIIPHLVQIREYADFRISLKHAEEMYAKGEDSDAIQEYINEMYTPVHEYNTVTGCWGQVEARAQSILLEEFCEKASLEIPRNANFDEFRKRRIYAEMLAKQETTNACVKFSKEAGFQLGMAYGEEETKRLIEELVEEGLLLEDEEGLVYLTDWEAENIKYSFN